MTGLLRLMSQTYGFGGSSGQKTVTIEVPTLPVQVTPPIIYGDTTDTSILTVGRQATWSITPASRLWIWYRDGVDTGVRGQSYIKTALDDGHTITVREFALSAPAPSNGISVTGSGVLITLGTLGLSATSFLRGTASSGTITGATLGSTITATGLPAGLTINSALRTWSWDGSGAGATSGTLTLIETLLGATNTPHSTDIGYSITVAAGGTVGQFDFSDTAQSGLLALLEDV